MTLDGPRTTAARPRADLIDGRRKGAAGFKATHRSVVRQAAHWAGLAASVATILFVTLYPHGSSGERSGQDVRHAAALEQRTIGDDGGPVTATLIDHVAHPDTDGPSTFRRR